MASRLLSSNFINPSTFIRTMSSSSALSNMKPLEVYSLGTPNGNKVTIFLEELKAVYPEFQYNHTKIDISKGTQKEPWFLEFQPNGRIPAIRDPNRNNFPVIETAAILLYLEKHYDPKHIFSAPSDSEDNDDFRSQVLQSMFFVHGGVGPMQGQANHFYRYAPEKIPYAINRYQEETKRLYNVLELMLKDKDWLVGSGKGTYSIADANAFPWVLWSPFAGVPRSELPPKVKAWVERNLARPATVKGLFVGANEEMLQKVIATGEDPSPPKHAEESK